MKKVFSNSTDVIHIFAQRSQSEGRSSNVFFYGDKIYSYGYHYLLAEFKKIKGETCIWINDEGYSSTTSKHIWEVDCATRQYKQYLASNVDFNLVYDSIKENYALLIKARKQEKYIPIIISKFESLTNYPLFDKKLKTTDEFKEIQKIYKSVSSPELLAKAKEAQRVRELKAKKAAQVKLKKDLEKFENYEIDYIKNDEDFLRISQDGTRIETSQSVKVAVDDAKLLYTMIKAGRDIKGHRISNYTVISINGHLKIGCHNINMDSVRKVGEKILTL